MATTVTSNQPDTRDFAAIQARIKPAKDLIGPARILAYSRNKIGKTHFAGSSTKRTLLIDCRDRGVETIANRPNVMVYPIDHYPEIEDLFWLIRTGRIKPVPEIIAFDNLTMLASIAMKDILGDLGRTQATRPLAPQWDQWNEVTQKLNNVIFEWCELPQTIIFLAQERVRVVSNPEGTEAENNQQIEEIGPDLSPAARSTLMGAVGTIGRLYWKEVPDPQDESKTVQEQRMLLYPRPPFIAGTRIQGMPRVMRWPTIDKILDIRSRSGEAKPSTTA